MLRTNRKVISQLISLSVAVSASTFVHAATQPTDAVAPSAISPISVEKTPMFISLGFDDNLDKDGLSWVMELLAKNHNPMGADKFANQALAASFFMNCQPAEKDDEIKTLWRQLLQQGHEIGNHTYTHPDDKVNYNPLENWMTPEQWQDEISLCNALLTKPVEQGGIGVSSVSGFRAPYLTYNDNSLQAIVDNGVRYDVSFPAGIMPEQNGRNNYWPYTLDNGSPTHDLAVAGWWKPAIKSYPGLWEVPLHTLIVPPDSHMEKYGLAYSLRDKVASRVGHFDPVSGKGDNFDWNLYSTPDFGAAGLSEDDVVAIYKYNLDLRLEGNRAPLVLGLHSGFYGYLDGNEHWGMPETTVVNRQNVLSRFVEYALAQPEVRFVTHKQIIDWVKDPKSLAVCPEAEWKVHQTYSEGDTVSYQGKNWQAQWWTMLEVPGLTESSPWVEVQHCTPSRS